MSKSRSPLWHRRSAAQVVAQYVGRRAPTQYAPTTQQRDRLIEWLCVELIVAIAYKVPNAKLGGELLLVLHRAGKISVADPALDAPDAR